MATLVTSTVYKSWRNITGSSQDTFITLILEWVSSDVRAYCDRDDTNGFESATRTEVYSGEDNAFLQLKEWPVSSITSVTQLWAGGSSQALDSSTYRVDAKTGILSRIDVQRGRFASYDASTYSGQGGTFTPSPRFDQGFNNFSVVYVAGYSTIPSNLQQAVCRLADILYVGRGRDTSIKSESLGQYSYTLADMAEVSKIRAELLSPFCTRGT